MSFVARMAIGTGSAVARNGEIVADSAEGYVDRSYCIKKAIEHNPDAELVIDDAPAG
jgi:hypothetical protein